MFDFLAGNLFDTSFNEDQNNITSSGNSSNGNIFIENGDHHYGANNSAAAISATTATIKPDLFYAQFRDQSRFWVQRVAVPIIMVIGLFGNLVTVIIMTRRRMRSTTNMYLAALAFVDILYLLLTFLLGLSHYPNMDDTKYYYYWQVSPFLLMLTDACSNTSVWLTVTFTVERFIAVRYPMKGKIWCTEQRARMNIIGVFIFGFLAASPVPFEWQIAEKQVSLTMPNPMPVSIQQPSMILPANDHTIQNDNNNNQSNSMSNMMINDYYDTNNNNNNNHYSQNVGSMNDGDVVVDDKFVVHSINDNNNNINNDSETRPNYHHHHHDDENGHYVIGTGKITTNKLENHATLSKLETNITTRLTLDYSALGRNENYRRIYYQLTAILFVFIPLLSLILFNGFLIKSVHESKRERQRMTGPSGNQSADNSTQKGCANELHIATNADKCNTKKKSEYKCEQTNNIITTNQNQVISLSESNSNNNDTIINVNGSTTTTNITDQLNNCDTKSRSSQLSSKTSNNASNFDDSNNLKNIQKHQHYNQRQPSILQRGASILKHNTTTNNNNNGTQNTSYMINNRHDNLQHHVSSQERRITIMLIAVVILFLVCQIPTAAMLIYRSVHDVIPNTNEDALLLGFGNIFNFLMATNAAGNFILYSFLSKKYRKTFVLLFCNCLKRGNDLTTTATSSSISQGKKLTAGQTTPTTTTNHVNSIRNTISTAV